MNGELWAPGRASFTRPYCGQLGSAAMDPIIPSYSWDSDEETEQSTKSKKQMNSSYSWRPGMETPGVAGNQVLLRLRKITAMRQLKADHPFTVKATKPKILWNIGKTKKGLDKRGNKRSDMVLYVLQTAFYRKLQENVRDMKPM